MTRAVEPILFALEVDGTGKVGARLAVRDELATRQVDEHGLVVRVRIGEVPHLALLTLVGPRDGGRLAAPATARDAEGGQDGGAGKECAGGEHGEAQKLAAGDQVVGIPVIREVREPAADTARS